ncbi:hypothetical protein HKD37_15G043060 [Glycine soja]
MQPNSQKDPQWNRQLSQRALRGRARAGLTGALPKGGKVRGVATNVYLWKTSEKTEGNRSKMKILSSGVVFTLEKGRQKRGFCSYVPSFGEEIRST